MRKVMFAVVVLSMVQPAQASWQLIPGKPYDGRSPVSVHKEPCWSAALSKCSFERSRKQYNDAARKAPQR
jgi:hypothetical protein